jgi:hypothetical protein
MHNLAVAGVAVASLTIGAVSGYKYAVKKLDEEYNAKMEEEIDRTKKFYQNVVQKEDLETTAFKAGVGEAAEALKKYQGVDTGTIFAEVAVEEIPVAEEVVEQNIFENADDFELDKENRDHTKPYIIDIVEYMSNDEYEQIDLTYYEGDKTLGDDKDEPIPDFNVETCVGRANLERFGASDPDQPHVLLVRNEKMRTDFNITHSDGSFAHEVAGLSHSDEPTFQRNHRRPRREE